MLDKDQEEHFNTEMYGRRLFFKTAFNLIFKKLYIDGIACSDLSLNSLECPPPTMVMDIR